MLGEYHLGVALREELERTRTVEVLLLLLFGRFPSQLVESLVDVLRKVLFINNILLLLSEYIHLFLGIFEPRMTEYLHCTESLPGVNLKERMNQISGMLGELGRWLLWLSGRRLCSRTILVLLLVCIRIVDVILAIDDQMVQFLHTRGLEGNRTYEHSIETDSSRPNIDFEAFITFVFQDFGGYVGWSTTLLCHPVGFCLELPAHTKISNLDTSICIEKYVVKFYVPVYDQF